MPNAAITTDEFKLLRGYIEKHCGISLGDEKAYLIETRLLKLMIENGCETFGAFYRMAAEQREDTLREKIIDAMTTNETLWFRDAHPYTILREQLLPAFAADLRAGRRGRIRIWSAACSTGQEPYSIAMTIHEFCEQQAAQGIRPAVTPHFFEILATDISPSALFLASAARYDQLSMNRGLPDSYRNRYFKANGRVWELDPAIRRMVTFKKFNLQDSISALGGFDLCFLRYVCIYFSEALKRMIFHNLASALAPSGCLFLGASESLMGLCSQFKSLEYNGGRYYQHISHLS